MKKLCVGQECAHMKNTTFLAKECDKRERELMKLRKGKSNQVIEGFVFSHFTKLFEYDDDGFLRFAYHVFACRKDYEKFHSPDCVKVRITVEVLEVK